MRVDAIDIKIDKKDAMKFIINKIPLMSRVVQFNSSPKDMHIEYVEFKVIRYEIITKKKGKGIFRSKYESDKFTIEINTYNGYSQAIEYIPYTSKKYISKSYIKKSKIKEEDMIEKSKEEILELLKERSKDNLNKVTIQDINILEISSIYKPYWIVNFRGKNILIDA